MAHQFEAGEASFWRGCIRTARRAVVGLGARHFEA